MANATRAMRARTLLDRLRRGPSLHGGTMMMNGKRGMTPNDAEWQVKNWLATWVTPEVLALVPELSGRRPH